VQACQYHAFRFVPDIDECKVAGGSSKYVITRIPFDLDKPPSMGFRAYSQFVNDFNSWLRDQGFKTKLRITGGKGAHILVEMCMDRIAENYLTPFPRALRFDTWIGRVGIDGGGLISAQATDFVKVAGLAYGCYRKNYLGRNSPITVEMHDVTQRYRNILVDSSRALKGMGVAGLGSIHHRTGGICMPVKKLPDTEELNLKSALDVSYDTSIKLEEFEPKYKSHWIQVVGKNPQLLYEEETKPNENLFSLVNDLFLKYGWIPNKYVEMGSEAFMKRYCWL
jgi:hypothetical protein